MKTTTAAAVLCLLAAQTNAKIKKTGLWTGEDWYDSDTDLGVKNGIPYSKLNKRKMQAAMTLETEPADYEQQTNVKRVKKVFPEADFNHVFAMKHDDYTYEGLIRAIAKYPKLCNENNITGNTKDETCKRELATIFAHFNQETGNHDSNNAIEEWRQGLAAITEGNCDANPSSCDQYTALTGLSATAYPADPDDTGVEYYGRGPFQISWNYNYGAFSEILKEGDYDANVYLLKNPDAVLDDSETLFFSALWFYMTPQSPKPSMHDVATGYMEPTSFDTTAKLGADFGTTINIINGAQECGSDAEYPAKAVKRGDYYKELLNYFDLDAESDASIGCSNQTTFPDGGYGDEKHYFDMDWTWGEVKCQPVNYQTAYSVYSRDDYKRCICDNHGDKEGDCGSA